MGRKPARRTSRMIWARAAVVAIVGTAVAPSVLGGIALATPPSGLSATPVAAGELDSAIRVKFKAAEGFGDGTLVHRIQMIRFELAPGGTFGWHQHGGPVWAIVTEGTLTLYSGDEGCPARTIGPGGALLDPGDHTHTAANLGTETVVIYATFMLPVGGQPRIDVPDPGVCS